MMTQSLRNQGAFFRIEELVIGTRFKFLRQCWKKSILQKILRLLSLRDTSLGNHLKEKTLPVQVVKNLAQNLAHNYKLLYGEFSVPKPQS